ncbi:DUF1501 domain-containing protein [Paracoccus denitrificans]|jgi:uncharacterized protein (DUF1501 family)|uniref:DUF1501 domain-containing protein n=1 Tax=Paracoccus denitrificans (strain Pd 1222) TaxID=318586 RepID=A1B429_PARDP|nr:DUF1501 domain-containing protein [Paracoccus denitrificans]ABL70273.1 protein of unknown function DUF1501 [Paracoccus denitrificans PD1222]MBB4627181.1 uncharacterized protein (DUF1501 family) [Paracoccus denitrificans]MCU7428046.1 DUF1501 domain-containing protein [Paracoccus denitrificans]QAR25623.1 DUF1501 domain-containing protein [Paracoccus denitrificans]UPV94521.1 DUF1501 domain-containing protein [Paracoccus denitrificans]
MPKLDRRLFLKGAALIGCSAAAHPLMNSMTFAALPGENRLVVIILRGAMDGLDAIQPYGDPMLGKLRRSLSVGPEGGALDLDGFYALHPRLELLLPLWQRGELAFAHAVSTPYRDKRSHFDGQDLLEAGTGNDLPVDWRVGGWLNRLLQATPGAAAETAYAVGVEQMRILAGKAAHLSWAPRASLKLSPQAQMLLEHVYHDDPLFRAAAQDAVQISGETTDIGRNPGPTADAEALAAFAASRLNAESRIAAFSIPGWDSHANQHAVLGRGLDRLAAAILKLREGLGPNWGRTAVLAMTEFGRTVRENGSGGTDHGTGGALLMAGGAIRGGRAFGDWPGLGEGQLYAGRDLMPVRDIRAYAAWAMHGLFGIGQDRLERTIFPGLDLGGDPAMLA